MFFVIVKGVYNRRRFLCCFWHGGWSRLGFDTSHERICVGLFLRKGFKREKGIWWMPWHREAMKDVAPCEKSWGVGSER